MVRRLFADHLPATDAPVDRALLQLRRPEHGLHAGAVDRASAAAGGSLALCATMGERTPGQLRGDWIDFSRFTGAARIPGGTVANHGRGRAHAERPALFL